MKRMKHHWRKMLEADNEGRPHLSGAKCEWCSIAKGLDDMPADIRTMFHSREADNLKVAWSWLHAEFPGECPGPKAEAHRGYRVIVSDRLETLVSEVDEAMLAGWLPSGSLVLQPALVTAVSGMRYFQAMVRS